MKSDLIVDSLGNKSYFNFDNFILHREDGPAIEHVNGCREWYLYGKRHREDGPAIENKDGSKYWFYNGMIHNKSGPAKILYHNQKIKCKIWYLNDKL